MARITVEDCIDKFPSRFELVLVASNRARKLHSGETPTVDKDNDKNTVIALREIASETLTVDLLKNDLIEEYQTATLNEDEDLSELNEENENQNQTEDILLEDPNLIEDTIIDDSSKNNDEISTEDKDVISNENNNEFSTDIDIENNDEKISENSE